MPVNKYKYMIKETGSLDLGDPQYIIDQMRAWLDYVDVDVYMDCYDDWGQINIEGWRPMTEEELAKAKLREKNERAKRKREREAKITSEIENAKKVLEKYGVKP